MKRLWIFKSSLLTNSSQFHWDNKFEFAMIDWCYCFGVGRMGLGIDILVSPFWFEFTLGFDPIGNHFRKVGKYQAIYWNESLFRWKVRRVIHNARTDPCRSTTVTFDFLSNVWWGSFSSPPWSLDNGCTWTRCVLMSLIKMPLMKHTRACRNAYTCLRAGNVIWQQSSGLTTLRSIGLGGVLWFCCTSEGCWG